MRSTAFVVVLVVLFLLLETYSFFALKGTIKNWSLLWQRIIWTAWTLGFVLAILGLMYSSYATITDNKKYLMLFASLLTIDIMAKFLLCSVLLLDDFIRLVQWVISLFVSDSKSTGGISRINFLVATGLSLAAIPFTTMNFGILRGAHRYTIHRKELEFDDLPEAFDGLKVVQISDIHSGSFWSKSAVEKGVQMLMDLKPDMVLFTGDIVNNEYTELEPYVEVFSKITAPMGVYAILGNHDYGDYQWGHQPHPEKEEHMTKLIGLFKELGWDLMLNENRILEKNNQQIALLGMENWGEGFSQYGDLNKTLQGAEHIPFKILMSHDPSHWTAQVKGKHKDIRLTLSGHTHGMQFGVEIGDFKWSPVKYRYKNWADLVEEDGQKLYVNRGFGYLGYAGRFGIWPEITELILKKKV